MTWLHHPRFTPTRDAILSSLRSKEVQFRKTKPVIFLCGGFESERRDTMAQYLRARLDALVFYAEDVWDIIARIPTANALDMEDQLAQLSDIVILIVESSGTFAELGAFSLSPPLRAKLLPILDIEFHGSGSFVETGPVRWVDQDSQFGPSIWVRLDSILDAAGDLAERMNPLLKATATLVDDIALSEKHQLFFVCDLVAVFGPCPAEHIEYYLNTLVGNNSGSRAQFFLAMACALRLVAQTASGHYFRPLDGALLKSFHKTPKYVDIVSLRARAISSLQTFAEGRAALAELEVA